MNAPQTVQPLRLRDRLRPLAPAASQALRALFARPLEWSAGGLSLRLQWTAPVPREMAVLETAQGPLRLSVASSSWRDDIGDRAWWDYQDESRTLAWGLAYETVLTQLGALLGVELRVMELCAAAPRPPQPRLRLGWELRSAEQRALGSLDAEAAQLLLWLQQPALQAAAQPLAAAWQQLPAQLRIALHQRDFPLAELRRTHPGDVLVLGTRTRVWSSLELSAGDRGWLAAWDRGRLRVLGPLNPAPRLLEPSMANSDAPPAEAAAAPDGATAAESIPLDLSFELGKLQLSLGELARLAPGYVFELPNRLEQAQVVLQANGRTIGRGELVAVGDTLGVQVLELSPNGLQ